MSWFRKSATPASSSATEPKPDFGYYALELQRALDRIGTTHSAEIREAGIWLGGKGVNEEKHRQDDLLHRLAVKYKPSKRYHNYIQRYSTHFERHRERVRRVVEIGVQTPGSMLMWEEYFPNAEIIGIDIDPACKDIEGGRKKIFIGDQKDEDFLISLTKQTGGEFDIVIDDGEHSEPAILKTFSWLFPAMAAHGFYAVEDTIEMPIVGAFFRQLERHINHYPDDFQSFDWPFLYSFGEKADWLSKNVIGVHFYRYLCIIDRGFNPEDNPYLHNERDPSWPGSHNRQWMEANHPHLLKD
jgi:hypothetical protein